MDKTEMNGTGKEQEVYGTSNTSKATDSKPKHDRDFMSMTDANIITRVVDDIDASEKNQAEMISLAEAYYKMYRGVIDEVDMREHGANLWIPATYQAIETIVPKIVLPMFSSKPYVHVKPLGGDNEEKERKSEKMQNLLDYQFENKIGIVNLTTKIVRNILINGTAFTKQDWRYEEKERHVRVNRKVLGKSLRGKFKTEKRKITTHDEPRIKQIKFKDFVFDPAGASIEECRYCADRYYADKYELMSMQEKGIYKNVEKIGTDNEQGISSGNESNSALIGRTSDGTNSKKEVEIWEYYTDEFKVVIANKSVVLYVGYNIFHHGEKPYARWSLIDLEGEMYGISVCDTIKDLQIELNATRNQRIDNVSMILNRMWKVLRGSNIKDSDLISKPNGVIEVDTMDDLEPIQMQDVTNSAYNEEAVIKKDIDNTLGTYDSVRGSNPTRRETATTSTILASAGGDRFNLQLTSINVGGFKAVVNQMIRLNQQFIENEVVANLMGDDSSISEDIITVDDIIGEWDIVAVGTVEEPTMSKEIMQNQLVQLLNVVKDNPVVNQEELLRRIMSAFNQKNIDKLINPPVAPSPAELGMQDINNPLQQVPNSGNISVEGLLSQEEGGTQ